MPRYDSSSWVLEVRNGATCKSRTARRPPNCGSLMLRIADIGGSGDDLRIYNHHRQLRTREWVCIGGAQRKLSRIERHLSREKEERQSFLQTNLRHDMTCHPDLAYVSSPQSPLPEVNDPDRPKGRTPAGRFGQHNPGRQHRQDTLTSSVPRSDHCTTLPAFTSPASSLWFSTEQSPTTISLDTNRLHPRPHPHSPVINGHNVRQIRAEDCGDSEST